MLSKLNSEQKDYLVSKLVGKNVVFSGYETVTMNKQLDDEVSIFGTIPNDHMDFTISCYYEVNSSNKITRVVVFVFWDWNDGRPSIRKRDSIVVNWDNNVFQYEEDTFSSESQWRITSDSTPITFGEYTELRECTLGGLGYDVDLLYSSQIDEGGFLNGQASFNLIPTVDNIYLYENSANDKTLHNTSITANYRHDKNPLSISSIYFQITGILLLQLMITVLWIKFGQLEI